MGLILGPVAGLLRMVPLWAYALAVALAWGAWQRHGAHSAAAAFQQAQASAAAAREQALSESIAETQRRLKAQEGVTREADKSLAKVRADAASAAGAAGRLRDRLAAIQAGARASDPAAAGAGPANRLAEVLGACAERYRDLAASADRAIIAGQACEASYVGLTK